MKANTLEKKEAGTESTVKGRNGLMVKVAELCPDLFEIHQTWRGTEGGGFRTYLTKKGEGVSGEEIDPLNDLNVCHEFEKTLPMNDWDDNGLCSEGRYRLQLGLLAGDKLWHATAEQRCRALEKTMEPR